MVRLRRSVPGEPGIRRQRRGRGFSYVDAHGRRIADDETLERERGTIGALTLERRHVVVSESTVRLDFPAKSGVRWRAEITDLDLAAAVRRAPRGRNARVSSWRDADATEHRVTATALTGYLRDATGLTITAKDLRTLLGSRVAAQSLARAEPAASAREQEARIRDAVVAVSEALRNTAAVARSSYIDPRVIERYRRGRFAQLSAGVVSDASLARLIADD